MISIGASKLVKHCLLAGLVLALVFTNAWFLYQNFNNVEEQESRVNQRTAIIRQLDNAIIAAADAERGMRGYLLTHNDTYLEPYRWAEKAIEVYLPDIRTKILGSPDQILELNTLEGIFNAHFKTLREIISKEQNRTLPEAMKLELIASSKSTMDKARAQIESMKTAQLIRLQNRTELVARSKRNFLVSLYGSTIILAIILVVVFTLIARNHFKNEIDNLAKTEDAKRKNFAAELSRLVTGSVLIETAGNNILEYFSKELGVPAGRIFLMESGQLKLYSTLGVSSRENPDTFRTSGNDLLQTAFERGQIWQINNVPANYWSISSSLGYACPSSLCFIPIVHMDQTTGIIEIGSFEPLLEAELAMLSSSQDVIGASLTSAIYKQKLQTLLEKTQQQAEELQTQQEELRTSNEELEQQARALESQQRTLNKKNEDLESASIQLQANAKELEASNKYKSEFLAKMSHELRTPLNGLMILTTLLIENKEKNLNERQLDFVKSIKNSGNDLLLLINDILDLAKVEARKLTIRPETFKIQSVIESKIINFGHQVANKGLRLETLLPEELSNESITTDRQRLDQILRNFMGNAIKFTDKGSITLSVRMNPNKDLVIFSVKDTGIGIPRDKQGLVFAAFEQADSSTSRKYGGTGLGLTISRELAHLLGGRITVTSDVGIGSEFSVELPITYSIQQPDTNNADDQKRLKAESAQSYSEAKSQLNEIIANVDPDRKIDTMEPLKLIGKDEKTVLIVEDDDIFRSSITEIVESYGFHPIQAPHGEAALDILDNHSPSAVLLDIRLPGISGLGVLEKIKQNPSLRHIPVHMISAFDYQHNALRMGALGYLTKPVTLEKVHAALDRITQLYSKKLKQIMLVENENSKNDEAVRLIYDTDIDVKRVDYCDALNALNNEIFDCLILNLTNDTSDGLKLLEQLHSQQISVPPIIIFSDYNLSEKDEKHLKKYSESIVIKGARSPERLLDEVNLFLHRMESLLPQEKQEILNLMRSQEKIFEGKTVLVVDDDIRNIFALTSVLEAKGINIVVARDGIEALEKLNEAGTKIDLVLMDIMMPRMDGYEAMKEIRKHSSTRIKSIPVIALTAKAMKGDHEKCMNAGASDYLPKPVNLDNLTTVLRVWLASKGLVKT